MRHPLALLILVAGISFLPLSAQALWQVDGVALSTAVNSQDNPKIVSDGAGGAIVTWTDLRNDTYDIYAQRVSATGAPLWTPDGVALCIAEGVQQSPTIISDGAGGAIVTWFDARSGPNHIYAQRVNASGIPQWATDGVALCTAANGQFYPTIVSDGAGGAIVTWEDYRIGAPNIYAQRVSDSGSTQWTADGVGLCTAANYQITPTIVSDDAGGAIVTWQDYRSSISYDIYAQWVNALGVPQWTVNGVTLCNAANEQGYPTIVSDGAAGAIVTWEDARTNRDIYAQRVDASGTTQWTVNGVALCVAADVQQSPTIVSDDAGGAIVTWHDARNSLYPDIYAQRVNALGAPQWLGDGVALCTVENSQLYPTIVSDGAGGAIVTWHDGRSGTLDIYAQHVNASGGPQWLGDGVALCTAVSNQFKPTIASDGAAGAIVTWHDARNSLYPDIYAQHVNASGEVPTGVSGPTRGPSLIVSDVYPSPFTGTASMGIELTSPSAVRIEVFDVAGRRVRTMTLSDAVSHRVEFNGRDDANRLLTSGVYFCRVKASGETITRKMVIAR